MGVYDKPGRKVRSFRGPGGLEAFSVPEPAGKHGLKIARLRGGNAPVTAKLMDPR